MFQSERHKKLKIYIHIGQPKTGSSSIQRYLSTHSTELLTNHGVWYPISDQGTFSGPTSPEEVVGQLSQIIDSGPQDGTPFQSIVLSHEGLLAQAQWAKALHGLVNSLHLQPFILCYIRRQDIWLESAWKQWGAKHVAFPTIQHYMRIALPNLNWMKQLLPWVESFGRECMVVRRFERREIGDDVVRDFLQHIDHLDADSIQLTQHQSRFVNRGFIPEVIELLSLLKSERLHDNSLLDLFEQSLGVEYTKNDPFAPYGLLSFEERKTILQTCRRSNEEIRDLFFKENGELFEPISENSSGKRKQSVTPMNEEHIRILLEIIRHQDKRINALESQLSGLEKVILQQKNHQ